MTISTTIKTIQKIMRKDDGVDGTAQRLAQLSWLLFLKIFDAQEEELEFEQSNYRSPIPEQYLWRNWAADKQGMTGEELMEFINNKLLPDLKALQASFASNPRGFVVREGLSEAYNFMKSGTLLRQIINKLNDVDFTKFRDRHLFGDIYEQLLRDLQSAGDSGEYYTPRAVTDFAVQMIDPKLGESIYDPACGTGGFLTCAIDNLRKQAKTTEDQLLIETAVSGIEKKQLPHLLCTTNMMLHGIEVPKQIKQGNTLRRPLSSIEDSEKVDIVVTNPPFGGNEEDGIEKNFPSELQTKETADLFLQYIIEMLKDGGRAAIVLPDTILYGDGVKAKIKKLLLEECNLHTIVRLPNSVFSPYTPIKTNILFFEKGISTKNIWFYEIPLPADVKAFNKTNPMKLDDFSACLDWWGEGISVAEKTARVSRQATEQAWRISVDEIIEREYNLDIDNPHVSDLVSHDPQELLSIHAKQHTSVQDERDQLKIGLSVAVQAAWPSISEHFDLLFSTADSVDKLKAGILKLAMTGKLVRQEANDEPASALLEKVKSEIVSKENSGLLKKKPKLASAHEDSLLYEIPTSWCWVQLGEIASHNAGKTLDSGRNTGDLREYITTSNLYWGKFDLTKTIKMMPIKSSELLKCQAVMGDLLICEGGEAGRAAVWPHQEPICFQNHIHRVRLFGGISPFFIYWFFQHLNCTGEIDLYRKGIGITNMSGKALGSIPIPLPPLDEQQRIVLKIDELMAQCDQLKTSLGQLEKSHMLLTDAMLENAL